MKLALKRLGIIAIASTLVCLPAVVFARPQTNAPFWYLLLSSLVSATGAGLFALAFGGISLIAGRNRQDGGLKIALVVTIVISLLLSYAIISAALSQR